MRFFAVIAGQQSALENAGAVDRNLQNLENKILEVINLPSSIYLYLSFIFVTIVLLCMYVLRPTLSWNRLVTLKPSATTTVLGIIFSFPLSIYLSIYLQSSSILQLSEPNVYSLHLFLSSFLSFVLFFIKT